MVVLSRGASASTSGGVLAPDDSIGDDNNEGDDLGEGATLASLDRGGVFIRIASVYVTCRPLRQTEARIFVLLTSKVYESINEREIMEGLTLAMSSDISSESSRIAKTPMGLAASNRR